MTRSKPITFLASAAVIPIAAVAIAACGGGGNAATAATPKTSSGASATVGVANSGLGSILVDSTGRTLYLFKADVGANSACTGACAAAWPPLLAKGKPTAGTGLTASKLGTITRSGGNRSGHLQRPPALPVHQGPKARPDNRPGRDRVRRSLVRAHSLGNPGLLTRIELRRRCELRRWVWVLAVWT